MKKFEFFSLSKDFNLAQNVAGYFKKSLHVPNVVRFADSEINLRFSENFDVSEKEIVVIHSTVDPINESLMELIFLIDYLKQMGAAKVHTIIPYFGYSRQCEYNREGVLGHSSIIAKMIEIAGADSVAVLEAHDKRLASFFKIPFEDIKLDQILAQHIKNNCINLDDCCLVAPDKGAVKRVERIAKILDISTLFFTKKRYGINKVEIVEASGKLACKSAIIVDDIIDTGSTAIKVANILADQGANHIYGYFVHPVFSGKAVTQLKNSSVEKVFVSNSIILQEDEKIDKVEVFDVTKALIGYLTK